MSIGRRLYNDFLRPSKEDDYELILQTAKEAGYVKEIYPEFSLEGLMR